MADPDPADLSRLRNIGIVAHIDAGKTTTTERVLFYTESTHKMGEVDDGTTETDFDPEESQRGITIYSAAVTCFWQGHTVNIIDTPGHVDFTAEVQRSLRVLDGAAVVFSAVEGVEAQSETVWRQADQYDVPRICFINKLDRIGADWESVLGQIETRLHGVPVAVTAPMMPGPQQLEGIIDLVTQEAVTFEGDLGEQVKRGPIPEQYADLAAEWRGKLLEAVATTSDALTETFLETDTLPEADLRAGLRAATLEGKLQPVFCGSSLHRVGVQPLLDGVVDYLPSPLDRGAVTGTHPNPKKADEKQVRKPDPSEPLAALAFKIVADKHGDLYFVRVYSGTLKTGSRLLNPRTGKKELVNQIWRMQADSRTKVDEVGPGDIVGLFGPKEAVTGDTLCDQAQPIVLESIRFPETVISMAVEPESSADRKKLEETMVRLSRQDPTFDARINPETGQTIVSGMGELHLEVIKNRMERDFNLKIRVHKPRVSYRETVKAGPPIAGRGEFDRALAEGAVDHAEVTVTLERMELEDAAAEPIAFVHTLPHDFPKATLAIVKQAALDEARGGGVVGYPLSGVKLTVTGVDYIPGTTSETALSAASARAVRDCLDEGDCVLLEPKMKLEVVTPGEFLGNIQADLQSRRAIITGSEPRGDLTVVDAEVALAKMFGYSTQVRSLSQGRASYSMELLKYDAAPPEVLEEMLG
ncbi:elongation factor G [Alienimonas californiensis]|uniref:Elongation factor G n=1 Tax=Alienimonas californiensis TaxID=2527989 RepID=A0A517P8G5_9PLAN|nr:elongation factor G [Alienimonas californiensis]QDT15668.1 Elongation factor G [Alienimonas californiensis]